MIRAEIVAGLERCALAWEADADRHFGRRRRWRLLRAAKLWERLGHELASAARPAADHEFGLDEDSA